MESLDCRGLPCPQPVVRCRTAVDRGAAALTVLVDNEPAAENVQRFLQGRGFSTVLSCEGERCWRLEATAPAQADAARTGAAQPGTPAAAAAEPGRAAGDDGARTLVLVTTETMGRGDEELGARLMGNFLGTLPELGSRLWRVVLVNGGVKLAARPGPGLEALQKLAAEGVSVLVCGTCLAHYGLLEAKSVGDTSNMLDIVTSLDLADKIIRP